MSIEEADSEKSLKRCKEENVAPNKRRSIIQEQTTEEGFCGWWILPIHLLYDILSRLPIDAIFSCRCVCKIFLKILTDSYFYEVYAKTARTDSSLIIQDKLCPSNMFLAHLPDLENSSSPAHSFLKFIVPTFLSMHKNMTATCIVGSCNGLICLSHLERAGTKFYICNPILGELVFTPHPRFKVETQYVGFGFCPKTNKYKLIRFVNHNMHTCEIYTLGDDHWRTIDNNNFPWPKTLVSFDTSFNGNLHWITKTKLICSLNLETEQFGYVSPPPWHILDQHTTFLSRMFGTMVGTLGGLFCVYYLFDRIQFEVWVQREYGVKESWMKKYSIDLSNCFGLTRLVMPIRLLDEGTLLLSRSNWALISYNLAKGTSSNIIAGVNRVYDAISHVSSFISLKRIMKSKTIYDVRRKKLGCLWSEEI